MTMRTHVIIMNFGQSPKDACFATWIFFRSSAASSDVASAGAAAATAAQATGPLQVP